MNRVFFISLFLTPALFSSLSLYNDSPFPLRVRVLGANGAFIGEAAIEAHGHRYIEDQIGTSDPVGEGENPSDFKNYEYSMTPYQVFWYCPEGTIYSACLDAAAGATVTANTCQGTYGCNPEESK